MATTLDRFADRKPGWDTSVMIESHQNGVRTKAMNPIPSFAVSNRKRDSERFVALNVRHLRREKYG